MLPDRLSPITLEPYTTEIITPGVTRAWSADKRLMMFTIDNASRPLIDAALDSGMTAIEHWPTDHAVRVMYQVLHLASPRQLRYVSDRIGASMRRTDLSVARLYMAGVMPSMLVVGAARVMSAVNLLNAKRDLHIKVELFTERDNALAWILSQPD